MAVKVDIAAGRFRPLGTAGSLIKVSLQFKLRYGLGIEGIHVHVEVCAVKVKGVLGVVFFIFETISPVINPTCIFILTSELSFLLIVFLASSTFSLRFSLSKNLFLARIIFPGSRPV